MKTTINAPAVMLATALVAGWAPAATHAQSVTANIEVDDSFAFYISTSDSVQGTLIGTGENWWQTYNFDDVPLTPGVVNYLHVQAFNVNGSTGFLGDFTLSDNTFAFANGTQDLTTETTDWTVSPTGFGQNVGPAAVPAPFEVYSILQGGIWLNDPTYYQDPNVTAYFSAQIDPVAVPEPSQIISLLAMSVVGGAGALIKFRRRK